MKNQVTGILLAGGKSSRMGTDKGVVLMNGKKLSEHVLQAMKPVVNDLMIIANNNNYGDYGIPVFEDIYKNCGPLGGIYTGLVRSKTKKNLMLSCDMPFITSGMLAKILSHSDEAEIIIPVNDGKVEPLCAVYDQSCAVQIRQFLESGKLKIQDVLPYFKTKEVLLTTTEAGKNFININTPQELNEQNR
ncbi:MAG: molybdenum cofactor guanylyltransferase [Bacteroidia bacterium]